MKKLFRFIFEELLVIFAQLVLWRHKPTVIAVTGSAGKTTTKEIIGSALNFATKGDVLIGFGNLGTVSGVPLSVLKINVSLLDKSPLAFILFSVFIVFFAFFKTLYYFLSPFYPKYLVLEVSADRIGDIKKTASYLQPDISVITNISAAHLEYFQTISGVKKEKEQLAVHTKEGGLVIIYGNNETAVQIKEATKAKTVIIQGNMLDFAQSAAREVGKWLKLSPEKIKQGADRAKLPKGRFDVCAGIKNTTIIDSSYNANPISVEYALQKFSNFVNDRRKIVVLGDMLELGKDCLKYHRSVGEKAKAMSDYLIAIGPNSKEMPADYYCQNIDDAYNHLLRLITPGDTILIKASHGMHLEKLVDKLKARNGV